MIRVLHVIGAMGSGGAEAVIMNLYRNIDRNQVQFDFVVHTTEEKLYDKEILRLGGKIFRTEKYYVKNYIAYKKWWSNFLKEHTEYKIIHGHIGSSAPVYLREAKKYERIAIAHSHSTKNPSWTLKGFLWEINSYPTRYIADYFFACSKEAAIVRFGKKVFNSKKCQILKNGIDRERFKFSEKKRLEMRKLLGIEDFFVVGHVGRFTEAKNHVFLIEIFELIYEKNKNARLLLIGEGELENDIKSLCRQKAISQAVIFAGVHQNVEDYYAAMDVFCFPSRWEGLPVALLEAQAEGLPCIISDNLPKEVDLKAGLIHFIKLEVSAEYWGDKILCVESINRHEAERYLVEAGFDIIKVASNLQIFYKSILNKIFY